MFHSLGRPSDLINTSFFFQAHHFLWVITSRSWSGLKNQFFDVFRRAFVNFASLWCSAMEVWKWVAPFAVIYFYSKIGNLFLKNGQPFFHLCLWQTVPCNPYTNGLHVIFCNADLSVACQMEYFKLSRISIFAVIHFRILVFLLMIKWLYVKKYRQSISFLKLLGYSWSSDRARRVMGHPADFNDLWTKTHPLGTLRERNALFANSNFNCYVTH